MSATRTYLVAYDIRAPRRLARVFKALSKVGYWLQYSVFAVDLDDRERQKLVARLRRLIDAKADDVRFYLASRAGPGTGRCRGTRCSPSRARRRRGSPSASPASRSSVLPRRGAKPES